MSMSMWVMRKTVCAMHAGMRSDAMSHAKDQQKNATRFEAETRFRR